MSMSWRYRMPLTSAVIRGGSPRSFSRVRAFSSSLAYAFSSLLEGRGDPRNGRVAETPILEPGEHPCLGVVSCCWAAWTTETFASRRHGQSERDRDWRQRCLSPRSQIGCRSSHFVHRCYGRHVCSLRKDEWGPINYKNGNVYDVLFWKNACTLFRPWTFRIWHVWDCCRKRLTSVGGQKDP